MTTKVNNKPEIRRSYIKENTKIFSSMSNALENAGDILTKHKITGYMLVVNYTEAAEDPQSGEKEEVQSYSLSTLGDIRALLTNAEYGVTRAALRIRQQLLNKNPKYH